MQNIKAIIFDFGGVIFNIDFSLLTPAFEKLGIDDFNEMYSQASADPVFKNLEKGKISEEEFYNAIRKYSKISITDEQIETAWNSMLLDFRKPTLAELARLKKKYYSILFSNTNSIHVRGFTDIYNRTIGEGSVEMYFHKVYYSHITGLRKPDAEAYEFILKENNLVPGETLLIDDSIQNIGGAKALGIQAIYLEKGMTIEGLRL